MLDAPKIDRRSGEELFGHLVADLKRNLHIDTDGGGPLAEGLLRVFSHYCQLIIQRLNRVPDKNHLAFLDVLNVSRIPPVPAQVPLTFTPVKKLPRTRRLIVVPAYTKVAAAPGEGESDPVVFETVRDLALTNVELNKILTLDPQTDLYADRSALTTPEGSPGEFVFEGKLPVRHEFYLGYGPVFGKAGISELRLKFAIHNRPSTDFRPQSIEWWIPTRSENLSVIPSLDTTSQLTRSGEVIFTNLPEWPTHERDMHWLGCRLRDRLRRRATADGEIVPTLPLVESVLTSAVWTGEEVLVDLAFFNNVPLDLSKDFFPFGEWPRFGDVFSLSSEAFATPRAKITLRITLTNPASAREAAPIPPVSKRGQPRIQWERLDGRRWVALECTDGTEALTENGEVSFLTPSPFPRATVNGVEGFWLRVRLIAGGYGGDERVALARPDQEPGRVITTPAPPSIQSILISSTYTVGPEHPRTIVTKNNLVSEEFDGAASFQAFRFASDPHPALYLGFKTPDDDGAALTSRPLDLYFHMSGAGEGERIFLRDSVGRLPILTWQYWNGQGWIEAGVEDRTESLTLPGTVTLRAGEDMAPWRESLFTSPDHRSLYWLRVLWTAGEFDGPPRFCRLLLNTVPATQTTTLENELLGSGNGRPHQTFYSARAPILCDLRLEVREPDLPAEEEAARTDPRGGDNEAVTIVRDAQGKIEQIWVHWREVDDFLSSGNGDRHFVVDRQTGEIRFGDGVKGLIPPVAANNIRLRRYQTGGGASGNKPAGSITQLRTSVLYVDSVVNLEPAIGGQDIEEWDSLRERSARWLRHRDRAVTLEDYEDLAKQASPVIAKTKCYQNRDLVADPSGNLIRSGVVSLIIAPRSGDRRPSPDLPLLHRVKTFLRARQTPDAEVIVLAPEYVHVAVEARVVAANPDAGASIITKCEEALEKYLHPVSGGPEGKGWEFGRRPHESDLYALLESIRDLGHVGSLDMRLREERPGLLESGIFLICSGEHRIRLG
jgi:hypothetical protein